MFDDTRDLNRDIARRDASLNDAAMSDGAGYGALVALAAIAVIVGALFWFSPSDKSQTASNTPAVERTAPAPMAPAPAAPAAPKQ